MYHSTHHTSCCSLRLPAPPPSLTADHNPSLRSSEDAKTHDGTRGGGVGVAEMRERKMAGQGLPSPQGGDTKPKPVQAVASSGEGGGLPKEALRASQDKYGGN